MLFNYKTTRGFTLMGLLFAHGSAHAQSAVQKGDIDPQKRFDKAGELMDAGMYSDACPILERILMEDPGAGGVRTELAICYERIGKLASAMRQLEWILDPRNGQPPTRTQKAREDLDVLSSRVSRLRFSVPDRVRALPARVMLDGSSIDARQWGQPILVDGGVVEVEVQAVEHVPWKTSVVVPFERGNVVVQVPMLERVARPSGGSSKPSVLGIVGGVSVGLAVSSFAFGAWATREWVNASREVDDPEGGWCTRSDAGDRCDPLGMAYWQRAESHRLMAWVGFGAGIGLGATGIALLAVSSSSSARVRVGAQRKDEPLRLDVGLGRIGLSGAF